jgi:hypothetical protein
VGLSLVLQRIRKRSFLHDRSSWNFGPELIRLTLGTSSIPPETGACEVNNIMSFSRFRLNGSDFLLPSETHLHIKEEAGVETDNLTVYSGCHEFLGESKLSFETPPDVLDRGPLRLPPR